jgi:hypothetical protein
VHLPVRPTRARALVGFDHSLGVVLHEPFCEQRRLVPRAPLLPGWIAGLPFLKLVRQIWACIFSHGRKSLLKRHGVIEVCSLPRELTSIGFLARLTQRKDTIR